jgi:hypothetical protein
MTLGIPTQLFLEIHVVISLVAIGSGLVVAYGLLTVQPFGVWTALFLATTVLTSVTGFPLPPFGVDPPRILGVILLLLLTAAVVALYVFQRHGPWHWIYIVTAVMALYLNAFVGVVQAFQKISVLQSLAPTQSELPFLIVQVAVLLIFLAIGILAVIRFRPEPKPGMS